MSTRLLKPNCLNGLLALLAAFCCSQQAFALPSNLTLQQLDHTSWTIQSGAPSGINALAQTTDGYLWLGTTTGLYRFDGVRFELFRPAHGQHLPDTNIESLYATREGGLWIGYVRGEASLLEKQTIRNYFYRADNMPRGTVISFLEDQDGSIWAAAAGGLGHFTGGKWHRIGSDMQFDSTEASYMLLDSNSTLWLTTTNDVYYLAKGAIAFVKTGFKTMETASLAQAPDSRVLIEDAFGIVPLTRAMPKSFPAIGRLMTVKNPQGLRVDRDGTIWEFPDHDGVVRLPLPPSTAVKPSNHTATIQHFTHTDGLTSDLVVSSLEDHEGNIWIATSRGLDRFRATAFTPAPIPPDLRSFALLSAPNGVMMIGSENGGLGRLDGTTFQSVTGTPHGTVSSLYAAPDGRTWIGGPGRLGYLQKERYVSIPIPPDPDRLVGSTITQAITTGPNGDLWVSLGGRHLNRVHGDTWIPGDTRRVGSADILATDHGGLIWAGYMKNIISVHDGNGVRFLDAKQGLSVGGVTALSEIDGRMWVGGEHGLNVFQGGRFAAMSFAGQAVVGGITGIVHADDGSLWLNASPGIFRISSEELAMFLKDSLHAVRVEAFDYRDGIPGDAGLIYPIPTAIKGTDGRLWFATTGGLVFIDPAHISKNTIEPPVAIRGVQADDTAIEVASNTQLPKGTRTLAIDFTALSFSIPERVRFRYKLDGFDSDWQEAGNRRQAFYTGLAPRHYVFRVIACNNDGIWNITGATLPIDLPATFLQSWSFKLLCLTLCAVALWWLYRLRMSQAEVKIRSRLYERLAERERIARDLHDTFFQGIQGLLLSFNLGANRLAKGDPVRVHLEETLTLSDQVMLEGRKLVLDLRTRSSEPTELSADLSAVAGEFAKNYPAQFELTVIGKARRLDTVVSEELYRIGREALYNAFRHAQATSIEVELTFTAHEMRLNLRDDGVGIPEDVILNGALDGHFGLPGMAERGKKIGARFSIFSRSGGGTEIEVRLSSRLAYRPDRP